LKKFKEILKLAFRYKSRLIQFLGFNLLAALFSVFSITIIVPFLKVIFKTGSKLPANPIEFAWNPDAILKYFDYQLSVFIQETGELNSLYLFSGLIILMFLLKNVFNYLALYNLAWVRSAVVRDLRAAIYSKILELPLSFYSNERKGDIISRMTNDVKEIEWSLLGALEMILKHPVNILIPLLTLFITSWQLTLFVLIVLPISGYVISRLGKKLKSAAKAGQEQMGYVISLIEETLSGLKIIKGFNAEADSNNRFNESNQKHFRLMVNIHRREFAASPLSEFMGSLVIASILIFGGNLILSNEVGLSGEYFIYYIVIFSQLIPPAKAISESFFRVQKGAASLERLEEIWHARNPIKSPAVSVKPPELKNEVAFNNVSFKYGDEAILKNISLKIPAGKTFALVGASGAGKSTMVDLLPRFHDVGQGSISLDGIDIREFNLHDLRTLMGIVTQESILFNDTVEANIRMGKPAASLAEIEEAAKIANAHEFIVQLPNGYQTNIGDRGGNLSGGQRQRLSIARAVLRNPPLLILDEATSALDTESERLVQDALDKLMMHRTSLVIAHRLSTIQHADAIIVMNQGEIVEQGTHEELLAQQGIYKRLCDLQSFV
jgi:ATP-binding cassette, subfamily B, bacterial MsbA